MARSSRFNRAGQHTARRRNSWDAGPSIAPTSLTAAGVTLWTVGAQSTIDGSTVVRTRGQGSLFIGSASNVLDGFNEAAVGICIVSENAFGAGAASVPAPLTDIAWDGWMWHMILSQFRTSSVSPETFQSTMEAVRFDIDSKAMRKIRESDVVIGVLELGTEIGTTQMEFQARTRILTKLP